MINKEVIEQFLAKPRESYDWLKRCSPQQLDQELPQLPTPLVGKLWSHQKAGLILINELRRFMLHMDMGAGKTLLMLALLQHHKASGEKLRAIVFVPYITSVDTWVEETAKHTPDLTCVPLLGSTFENSERLNTQGDLFVICYQSAVAMLAERREGKWRVNAKEIRQRFATFNMLVMDEIHKCKNVSSLTYRMCRAISAQSQWVFGLTGTPFGRDLTDLWPQFNLIDFGETLGPTLGFYREVFFSEKRNYWGGYDHKFKQKLLPDLKRIIKHKSIHYSIDEFYDMPPKDYVVRHIRAPDDSEGYCTAAFNAMQEALEGKGKERFRIVESNYLQLRQLSSGFMTLKGDDNDRIQVKFDENPKLDMLQELIEAMPYGCKMVVFHHFVYSNGLISDRLKQMKVKHARIWGGQKNSIAELRKFKDDDSCTVLVINTRSGSSSLNLQLANYVVFFEQPDSPIDRQQAERRCWRPGQAKRVWYYDLLVRGTVDHRIWKANKVGENLLQSLLSGKRQL